MVFVSHLSYLLARSMSLPPLKLFGFVQFLAWICLPIAVVRINNPLLWELLSQGSKGEIRSRCMRNSCQYFYSLIFRVPKVERREYQGLFSYIIGLLILKCTHCCRLWYAR
ncbi:unnamed protein product [Linum tenue]|uniref:Uncharacterized protein n=1 Tax=Linum tenue TaxID=586396 RepID=A0AAV0PT30_9ROSI|nr:unnamed protein product [Linum tenue]